MSGIGATSVAVNERSFIDTFIKTTAVLVVVASTSGIYTNVHVLKDQELSSKQKTAPSVEVKRHNLFSSAKPNVLEKPKPRLINLTEMNKPIYQSSLLEAKNVEENDFVYADDFDTVDNSNDSKSIYVTLSYGGHLPAASDDDFDFVYADDFDTVDNSNDSKKLSMQQATGGRLFDGRDRG
ncbi:hypothetical protein [Planococcus alpniumensis]|uniref:hypothetical protein n=1 Tax=Planococcus alpniumensis TaxID=2708345 RepID=UPI001B8D7099|nr:hypothetical protein [Planococcus sp. MSAK28401]